MLNSRIRFYIDNRLHTFMKSEFVKSIIEDAVKEYLNNKYKQENKPVVTTKQVEPKTITKPKIPPKIPIKGSK